MLTSVAKYGRFTCGLRPLKSCFSLANGTALAFDKDAPANHDGCIAIETTSAYRVEGSGQYICNQYSCTAQRVAAVVAPGAAALMRYKRSGFRCGRYSHRLPLSWRDLHAARYRFQNALIQRPAVPWAEISPLIRYRIRQICCVISSSGDKVYCLPWRASGRHWSTLRQDDPGGIIRTKRSSSLLFSCFRQTC